MEIKSTAKTWHMRICKSLQFKSYAKENTDVSKVVFWVKGSFSLMENGTLFISFLDGNNFNSHQNAFSLIKII